MLVAAAAFLIQSRGPTFRDHLTLSDERSVLTLPDSTRVVLGAYSRLRVPHEFGASRRAVELEGEAHFVVRHDIARPFIVRTPHGSVEVLGTAFTVRAYPGENLEVVVVAGVVALRAPAGTAPIRLGPGDRGVMDLRGVATVTRAAAAGVLVFDSTRLDSAIARLAGLYGVDIALSPPSLAERRLTLTVGTESASDALAALAHALNLEFGRAGDSVCISEPPDRPRSASWRCP